MNHEEVAKKVASDHFAREQRGECPIAGKLISDIAAALRRAANEAAWRGHDIASQYGIMSNRPASEIVASEYGPRPEGGTR